MKRFSAFLEVYENSVLVEPFEGLEELKGSDEINCITVKFLAGKYWSLLNDWL